MVSGEHRRPGGHPVQEPPAEERTGATERAMPQPGRDHGDAAAATRSPAWPSPGGRVLGLQASVCGLCCGGFRTHTGLGLTARRPRTGTPLALPGMLRAPQGLSLECAGAIYIPAGPHTPEADPGPAGVGRTRQGGDMVRRASEACPCLGGKTWSPLARGLGQTWVWVGPPCSHQQLRCTAPGVLSCPHLPSAGSSPAEGTASSTRPVRSPAGAAPCPTHCL